MSSVNVGDYAKQALDLVANTMGTLLAAALVMAN